MKFHPFSNVPANECMCCGGEFGKQVVQSANDNELCIPCYLESVDFPIEEEEEEYFPSAEDLADYTGNY